MRAIEKVLFQGGAVLALMISANALLFTIRSNQPIFSDQIPLWSVSFLTNGDIIAGAGGGGPEPPSPGEVDFWDMKSRTKRIVLKTEFPVRSVASSRSGSLVAIGDFGGSLYVMNSFDWRTVDKVQCAGPVNAVAWSPEGNLIAASTLSGELSVLDWKSGHIQTLPVPEQVILNVGICVGERLLAFTTRSGKAYLAELPKLTIVKELDLFDARMHEANAEALAFSPSGQFLWTGCDKYVRCWDLKAGQAVKEFPVDARVNSLAMSSDGRALAAIDSNGVLSLWNVATEKSRLTRQAHKGTGFCVTFSADDRQISTVAREDFVVKTWDPSSLRPLLALSALEK
jgi:WD40 repeat protein